MSLTISTRDKILSRVRALSELPYDYDGVGSLSLRPDVYSLAMDAVNARPPLLNFGRAGVSVDMEHDGILCLKFCPDTHTGRVLELIFLDGSAILCVRLLPSGGRINTMVQRGLGGEARTREELDELFAWLNEEVR